MSIFKIREKGWLVAAVCGLAWIVLLSFALSCLFGAKFSGGWIIAGTMFSIATFCGLLIIREITEAILSLSFLQSIGRFKARNRGTAAARKPCPSMTAGPGILTYSAFCGSRRAALGLRSDKLSSNRRRKPVKARSRTSGSRLPNKDFARPALYHTSHLNQRFS